jgi:hypothetical protein
MPCRIILPDWIIVNVCIPVPGLHALRLDRHDGIGLKPASQQAVVPAGAVIMQSQQALESLPGKLARERCLKKIDLPY